jgi:hypothetical protein
MKPYMFTRSMSTYMFIVSMDAYGAGSRSIKIKNKLHRNLVAPSKPGQNTRYPLPVSEIPDPGSELPEPEVPDPKFG